LIDVHLHLLLLLLLGDTQLLVGAYLLLDRHQELFDLRDLPFRSKFIIDLLHKFHAGLERLLQPVAAELRPQEYHLGLVGGRDVPEGPLAETE